MAITLEDAQTELEQELRDIADVDEDVFITWCDYINKFTYRKLIETDPSTFLSSNSYTVSSNPSTQALPSDFRSINSWGCGLFYVDNNSKQTDDELLETNFGSQDRGFYLEGSNIIFTGINSTQVYTMKYIPSISKLTALTDEFVIRDEYNQYINEALKLAYYKWDEDPTGQTVSDQRFARDLEEVLNTYLRKPSVFSLDTANTPYVPTNRSYIQ